MRRVIPLILLFALCVTLLYGWLVLQNNKHVPMPSKQEIRDAYENAVSWLQDNRSLVLDTVNPALWRMVQKSAFLTGDERLKSLFSEHFERYYSNKRYGYGHLWFKESGWAPVTYDQIENLDDYQKFFAYALTCDDDLGNHPLISAQKKTSYCDDHRLRSSCVTHQMMGLQLLLERGCGDTGNLSETMSILQKRAAKQLVWDPRLLDQYIQRVLMLIDTGAADMVKPVWITRILEGSLDDGGWPERRMIVNLPGKEDLIFTRNFIGLGEEKSLLHATAQALLILSLLLVDVQD